MIIPRYINIIVEKFMSAEGEIFAVGGAVRDMLLNREVKDWDFTTNLAPEQIMALFPKNNFYNNNFGTISIILKDNHVFEVTTFRTEQGYSDSRHPDQIKWGKTIEEDLERRDFTINALAIKLPTNLDEPPIIDLFDGIKDLRAKIIRTVGNADQRFGEDALRMMRAIRLASQLGFLIEENTFKSIQTNAHKLKNISAERIREEFFKTLTSPFPAEGMNLLKNSGLLEIFMPELLSGLGMTQKGHHIYDVWKHSLETLKNCQSSHPVTRMAALLHDIGKPIVVRGDGEERSFHNHEVVGARVATAIGKRLKFSKKELDQLFKLVRWHMFTTDEMQTDKAVRRFIKNVTPEYIDEMIALRRGDRLGSGAKETSWRWELFKKRLIEVQKQPFSIKDLKVDGNDVMKILQIKPSKKVGEVLDLLFAEVENDPSLNTREILLEKIEGMRN